MSFDLRKGGGIFQWHVISGDGSPDVPLTIYASKAGDRHSAATAKTYIRHLLAFATWAAGDEISIRQRWTLNGEPDAVRALVCRFLSIELKGVVTLTTDKRGFEIRRVECKFRNRRGDISHLLAALRSYYEVLIREGQYCGHNPMVGTFSAELIAQERNRALERFAASHGRNPMPQSSGVDNFRWKRASDSYFRLMGNSWEPEVLDDPALQQAVLSAGAKYGWSRRDMCIARIMFDTGCRISEACSLRVIDWLSSNFGRTLRCSNKGSRGERTKTLFLSDKTLKLLRAYLTEDHPISTGSFLELTRMKPEHLDIPLFTTRTGSELTADWYRRNSWTPALRSAGLLLRPHQVRHWFVTTAMLHIDELSSSPEQREMEREKLRIMMGWQSDMIPVYNHAINRKTLPLLAAKIHEKIELNHRRAVVEMTRDQSGIGKDSLRSAVDHMLEDLVGSI